MLHLLRQKLHARSPPLPLLPSAITLLLSSSPAAADSNSALVFSTLRSHGVPDHLYETLLSKQPRLRTIKPEKTLCPKLAFLRAEGFSGPEVAEILLRNPSLVYYSLERSLAPSVNLLKSILPSKEALFHVLTHTAKPLNPHLVANINVFKVHGLPEATILKVLLFRPRLLACTPGKLVDALEYLKKLNISRTSTNFVIAVSMLSYLSRSTFHRKLELYKELGWTQEQVLTVFTRRPTTFSVSDQTIRKKVSCFRDTMGWSPEFLFTYPVIMTLSLEKRILPRCAVLNVLMSNGLLKRNTSSAKKFTIGEGIFVEKFVKKYEKTAPGVVRAYEGKIKFSGWDWLKDTKNQPETT